MEGLKQRHGCVTFWTWLIIIVNLILVMNNTADIFDADTSKTTLTVGCKAILQTLNILACILIMKWNRRGFHIYIIVQILLLIISKQPGYIVLYSIPIMLWWVLLQIRQNGISTWKMMNDGWDYKHCRHLYQFFIAIVSILTLLTLIAYSSKEENRIVIDNNTEITSDTTAINNDIIDIAWKLHEDSIHCFWVKAPSDFRRIQTDYCIMALGCSDYDPYITVDKESVSSLEHLGITTPEDYSNAKIKEIQNSGGTDFKKLGQKITVCNFIVVEYEMSVDGNKCYYQYVVSKTQKDFFFCQVVCLDKYKNKLKEQIDYIIDSFAPGEIE